MRDSSTGRPDVSVVVPVLNEASTLAELAAAIHTAFEHGEGSSYELIFVDDGSSDGSWSVIERLSKDRDEVRGLRLRRNFGKAAALALGASRARADVLVTLDGDLQDDPAEIPRFLEALGNGYDLVSGWKENRRDPIGKTLPSRFFNWVTRITSGVRMRDFNSGFKCSLTEVYRQIPLYGELHRYIPVLADNLGYRVTEIPVHHRPRQAGRSKYGWERYVRGFLDLLTVVMITRYGRRPGHLFGGLGIVIGLLGFAILGYLTGVWFLTNEPIGNRPLLLLGVLLEILAFQSLTFGMLAELILHRTPSVPLEHLLDASTGGDV